MIILDLRLLRRTLIERLARGTGVGATGGRGARSLKALVLVLERLVHALGAHARSAGEVVGDDNVFGNHSGVAQFRIDALKPRFVKLVGAVALAHVELPGVGFVMLG